MRILKAHLAVDGSHAHSTQCTFHLKQNSGAQWYATRVFKNTPAVLSKPNIDNTNNNSDDDNKVCIGLQLAVYQPSLNKSVDRRNAATS